MSPLSQNDRGRAFEYGVAIALSERLPATLVTNTQLETAKRGFELCARREQEKIVMAAREAAAFLVAHDTRLSDTGCHIHIQSDQMGQEGDVRDIIVTNRTLHEERQASRQESVTRLRKRR